MLTVSVSTCTCLRMWCPRPKLHEVLSSESHVVVQERLISISLSGNNSHCPSKEQAAKHAWRGPNPRAVFSTDRVHDTCMAWTKPTRRPIAQYSNTCFGICIRRLENATLPLDNSDTWCGARRLVAR
jgi:hypothetical protein